MNTDHFVPGLMLPRSGEISSSVRNARLCSNKPFADDSVSARPGGFEGKFGEISGTNDVQPVTTGQFPHNFQGRNIDKYPSVIRRPV